MASSERERPVRLKEYWLWLQKGVVTISVCQINVWKLFSLIFAPATIAVIRKESLHDRYLSNALCWNCDLHLTRQKRERQVDPCLQRPHKVRPGPTEKVGCLSLPPPGKPTPPGSPAGLKRTNGLLRQRPSGAAFVCRPVRMSPVSCTILLLITSSLFSVEASLAAVL